jgi:phosphoglucosamine mutase
MNYFGTDGMRGRFGATPITKEYFYEVGRALATVLQKEGKGCRVIIGRDTRKSGRELELGIKNGLIDGGISCLMVGVLPTPGVSYLVKKEMADIGLVISASHNHSADNGVKIFSSNGNKIDGGFQNEIVKLLESKEYSEKIDGGLISEYDGLVEYKNKCLESTPIRSNTTLKIVVDCANGAASEVAQQVFSKVMTNIEFINAKPDGVNINLNCGSTSVKSLSEKVVEVGADAGIALDGDADRLIMVDAEGTEVDGDGLVYILAKHWKETGRLLGDVVIGTVMTNYGTRESLNKGGIRFIESDVGDKYVLEKMLEHGGVLGGECSGHIICMDRIGCGDGIISALQVIEVMIDTGKTLKKLNSTNIKYPYLMKNIEITKDVDINSTKFKDHLVNKNNEFREDGRILIRKSGTEPVIRILIEHKNQSTCESTMKSLLEVIN